MIANTVTVALSDLLTNYSDSMIHLIDSMEDGKDKRDITVNFTQTLTSLLLGNNDQKRNTIRREFAGGNTMMVLPPDLFAQLEDWECRNLEFVVIVTQGTAKPFLVLTSDEVMW